MHDLQAARGTPLNTSGSPEDTPAVRHAKPRRRIGLLLGIAVALLGLDQLTKHLAVTYLGDGQVVEVIGELLQFRLIRNSGAAFGLFVDMTVILTLVAAAVVIVILRMSRRLTSLPWAIALGGLLGGTLGNLTDRLFREPEPLHGHVVDFIELPNFPLFNLADSAIVIAAVLIALLSLKDVPYEPRVESEPEIEPQHDDEQRGPGTHG